MRARANLLHVETLLNVVFIHAVHPVPVYDNITRAVASVKSLRINVRQRRSVWARANAFFI